MPEPNSPAKASVVRRTIFRLMTKTGYLHLEIPMKHSKPLWKPSSTLAKIKITSKPRSRQRNYVQSRLLMNWTNSRSSHSQNRIGRNIETPPINSRWPLKSGSKLTGFQDLLSTITSCWLKARTPRKEKLTRGDDMEFPELEWFPALD